MAHEPTEGRYLQGVGGRARDTNNLGMVVLLGGPGEHPLHASTEQSLDLDHTDRVGGRVSAARGSTTDWTTTQGVV